jgi:hypothetical protein
LAGREGCAACVILASQLVLVLAAVNGGDKDDEQREEMEKEAVRQRHTQKF